MGLQSSMDEVVEALLAGAVRLELEGGLLPYQAVDFLQVLELGLLPRELEQFLLILVVNLMGKRGLYAGGRRERTTDFMLFCLVVGFRFQGKVGVALGLGYRRV